jgi:hypothetical protein
MTSGILLRSAVAILTVALACAYAAEVGGTEFDLATLMRRLSQIPAAQARFSELKHMAQLTEPLALSGILSYVRPDRLEKRVISPYPERIVVAGDKLTIESQDPGQTRTLRLSSNPVIWAFVESIRATLAGDLAALERHYRVQFEGSAQGWLLSLYPRLPEMQRYVAWIRIDGVDDRLRGLEIQEANGDRSVMTIIADHPT